MYTVEIQTPVSWLKCSFFFPQTIKTEQVIEGIETKENWFSSEIVPKVSFIFVWITYF